MNAAVRNERPPEAVGIVELDVPTVGDPAQAVSKVLPEAKNEPITN